MSECTNGEMRDLLPELVSGRLSAEMQLAVEAHVAECEECAGELTLLRALRPALMRGPVVDARRIAAAVRAQVPASARSGSSGASARWSTPRRLAIAAAALLAVSAAGYVVATRGRSAPPEIAVVHTVGPHTNDSSHQQVIVAPVPAPQQQVAVAPQHVATPSADVLDNLSDLSDDDVRTLTASLDGMSAVPDAEPASGIDPLGATLDDQSAGGS